MCVSIHSTNWLTFARDCNFIPQHYMLIARKKLPTCKALDALQANKQESHNHKILLYLATEFR